MSIPSSYWALRGGTGNFGVVTSWTMRLFPMGDAAGRDR